ncbi:MAG: hypothetical protein PHC54_05075 [Candidatus Omnitrophica bacterium]|nr:hypothetical protein [Candidatus Omnitrophota bacterium]MDD5592726.1 hypothetical protein [Candidatus Omnitrophota bacterium]
MLKKGLILGFLLLFILPCLVQGAPEDEGETFTIATYYPSPYGSYNELETNKFAVGDTDQPPEKGQIAVARSVIYNPVNKDGLANPQRGELVYGNDEKFYFYTSSGWKLLGEAEIPYSTCKGLCFSDNNPTCSSLGEGWTMVTYASGNGCAGQDFGNKPAWGGNWSVTITSASYYAGGSCLESFESLRLDGVEQCSSKCSRAFGDCTSSWNYLSSQAICCK